MKCDLRGALCREGVCGDVIYVWRCCDGAHDLGLKVVYCLLGYIKMVSSCGCSVAYGISCGEKPSHGGTLAMVLLWLLLSDGVASAV